MTTLYDDVISAVPRLRRYARLLTGSREAADEYVQICLERLVQDAATLGDGDLPVEMYRTFHRYISDREIELDTSLSDQSVRLERELVALPVDQRKAILLVAVENFSREDAAYILGQSVQDLSQALSAARATFYRNFSALVFVIEDALRGPLHISRVVEELGLNVCGTAARGNEAVERIEASRPTLIVADVQFSDGTNHEVDACERVRAQFEVPVIYVSRHPERVRRSVRRKDALVLRKPVSREALRNAVGRALGVAA